MSLVGAYFSKLYHSALHRAYAAARAEVAGAAPGTRFLDCGSGEGRELELLRATRGERPGDHYAGLEWSQRALGIALGKGLPVVQGDLNRPLPVESASVDCAYAFSVLEHLLMPCAFLAECHRVLRPGGRLVLLTPNISTYFTAALVLAGRMPSSGPHPDALSLQQANDPFKVSGVATGALDGDTPEHRHLVVFSYSALRRYLEMAGFKVELARGFGLYPLPLFLQPLAERIDPWHCHQLVFACSKR